MGGGGQCRMIMGEAGYPSCKREVKEVTGAALPPPSRCLQEATLDEEALDEEEREDRYMAAALGVFMDYLTWG